MLPPGSPMMISSPTSGNNAGGGIRTPVRRPISLRTLTPYPKNSTDVGPVELEQTHIVHFREAATHIPCEYKNDLGTFIVRRPYGMETFPRLFQAVNAMPMEHYRRRAHVSDLTTIEIAVEIAADRSLFLLHGTAGIQYFNNDNGHNLSVPNVDELDRPLGIINYIDSDANEKDYSLDEILEKALLVREQYCSAMMSTAIGLKDRPVEAPAAAPPASPPAVKVSTSDVGTGTDPSMFPPEKESGKEAKAAPSKSKHPDASTSSKSSNPPKSLEEDQGGSGDVLAMFFGMIFKGIFGVIWWFLVTLPIKIFSTTLISFGTLFVLGIVYLKMLEFHNIVGLGSTFGYNAPGIL